MGPGQRQRTTATSSATQPDRGDELAPGKPVKQQADAHAGDAAVRRIAAADPAGSEHGAPPTDRVGPDGVRTSDVMYEEMAHLMAYLDQLGDLERSLLTRWGFQPDWVPLRGGNGLFAALFLPAHESGAT